MMTRTVFMGTPDFAVPTLQALLDSPNFDVVGVVTQPDRPAGRGRALRPSPVKQVAAAAGIPLFQPRTLRTPEAYTQLADWQPDIIVVAAFGQILRQNVLDLPQYGCINVHASLLPRWRGAAPIQAAIRAGDTQTGITIMVMDAGLDTGPMLAHEAVAITPDETGQSLHDKLAAVGGPLLIDTLPRYLAGTVMPQPQPDDESMVTYASQIKKEDGVIQWTQTAAEIDRLVRAFTPWPGTSTLWEGKRLKVIAGHPAQKAIAQAPGTVVLVGDSLAIATGDGIYIPSQLQLAGKKPVQAKDFVRGHAGIVGASLG